MSDLRQQGARMTRDDVIRTLNLKPHPEGGWYAETHRIPDPHDHGHRSPGTAIYYLLGEGERSHWHKVDATEIWHYYAGGPLELSLAVTETSKAKTRILGPELAAGQRPQLVVPPHCWQAARTLGAWTLVGCTVSPGFDFSGFVMAPPDWSPGS
jgi:predicted cupin superfamily sugar epimerase